MVSTSFEEGGVTDDECGEVSKSNILYNDIIINNSYGQTSYISE